MEASSSLTVQEGRREGGLKTDPCPRVPPCLRALPQEELGRGLVAALRPSVWASRPGGQTYPTPQECSPEMIPRLVPQVEEQDQNVLGSREWTLGPQGQSRGEGAAWHSGVRKDSLPVPCASAHPGLLLPGWAAGWTEKALGSWSRPMEGKPSWVGHRVMVAGCRLWDVFFLPVREVETSRNPGEDGPQPWAKDMFSVLCPLPLRFLTGI